MKTKIQKPGSKVGTSKLWFLWPDTHFPDHDERAVACAKALMALLKPHNTVFLGDIMDCSPFASHAKRTLKEVERVSFRDTEIDPTNDLLDFAQKHTKQEVYFLEGNHEHWVENRCAESMAFASIYDDIAPRSVLSKGRSHFHYIPYSNISGPTPQSVLHIVRESKAMKSGPLIAVHGWSAAKNAASKHLERAQGRSIIFGHTHRSQYDCTREWDKGHRIIAQSFGCLRTLQPSYARGGLPNDWVHGIGLLWVGRTSWEMQQVAINDGVAVLPDGREVSV